jgi:hypothetical protein
MTYKQKLFADFLLKSFGFEEGDHLETFKEVYFPLFNEYLSWDFMINNSVDVLMAEKKFRKEAFKFIKREKNTNTVSASDIGSFVFCPASFSISKTFEVPPNEQMRIGTRFHQKGLLAAFKNKEFRDGNSTNLSADVNSFLGLIAESKYIFGGHREESKNIYFRNEEISWIGQPDYIFIDRDNQYFVVEEKFRIRSRENENFDSYGAQLLSYIHFIKDREIRYGFLVVWNYEYFKEGTYQPSELKLSGCKIYRYNKDERGRQRIESIVGKIKQFKSFGDSLFEHHKVNPVKCARCSKVFFCGHKVKKFSNITFPYHTRYLKIYSVPFPKELEKKTQEEPIIQTKTQEVEIDPSVLEYWNQIEQLEFENPENWDYNIFPPKTEDDRIFLDCPIYPPRDDEEPPYFD